VSEHPWCGDKPTGDVSPEAREAAEAIVAATKKSTGPYYVAEFTEVIQPFFTRALDAQSKELARLREERDAYLGIIRYVCKTLECVDCGAAPPEELARRAARRIAILEQQVEEMKDSLSRCGEAKPEKIAELRRLARQIERIPVGTVTIDRSTGEVVDAATATTNEGGSNA
jgi:phage shock protein A